MKRMEKKIMNGLDRLKKVECTCQECISYCERTPGWFRLGELPLLAEFLELPVAEVFGKYLIADFWTGESEEIFVLAPMKDFDHPLSLGDSSYQELIDFQRRHNEEMGRDCDRAGRRASWGYAFCHARCVFLKEGRCMIYPVRPFECAVVLHGKKNPKDIRELIAKEWEGSSLISDLNETKK